MPITETLDVCVCQRCCGLVVRFSLSAMQLKVLWSMHLVDGGRRTPRSTENAVHHLPKKSMIVTVRCKGAGAGEDEQSQKGHHAPCLRKMFRLDEPSSTVVSK